VGLGWKAWTRERLTADEMQGYIQDQVIAVFATNSDRDLALGTGGNIPEGLHCYVTDSGRLLVRVGTGVSSSWQVVGGAVPGISLGRPGTQTLTAGTWTLTNGWSTVPAVRAITAAGMRTSDSRFTLPTTGRWALSGVFPGATNVQARLNSGGSATGGTMLAAVTGSGAAVPNLSRADFGANGGDHVEFFVQRDAAGTWGTQSGYDPHMSLVYMGRY
jgi:hypothetical protein